MAWSKYIPMSRFVAFGVEWCTAPVSWSLVGEKQCLLWKRIVLTLWNSNRRDGWRCIDGVWDQGFGGCLVSECSQQFGNSEVLWQPGKVPGSSNLLQHQWWVQLHRAVPQRWRDQVVSWSGCCFREAGLAPPADNLVLLLKKYREWNLSSHFEE